MIEVLNDTKGVQIVHAHISINNCGVENQQSLWI